MKKIMIVIVVVLLLFVGALTIYKNEYDKKKYIYYVTSYDISNLKSDYVNDIYAQDDYMGKITISKKTSVSYKFAFNENFMKGKVYISSEKYLHIYDEINDIDQKVSNVKFKSLYANNTGDERGFTVYALSEENKPYLLNVVENDINKVTLNELYGEYIDFVDVEIKRDKYKIDNAVFALGENEYIYNVNTGLLYNPNTISLYNKIYVYEDNTMTNMKGNLIVDKNHQPYKLKYIFNIVYEDEFIDNTSYIAITEDNKFLYFNDDLTKVYELNRKVKEIDYEKIDPYVMGTLIITFDMNSKIWFVAECNEYYCVN